jgi:hypothetical protein
MSTRRGSPNVSLGAPIDGAFQPGSRGFRSSNWEDEPVRGRIGPWWIIAGYIWAIVLLLWPLILYLFFLTG